jgi:hypothetical protein
MQPLNAIDALAPAFTRTHETLFHPFKLGRSWKLAASSYLGFAGAMFIPFPFFFLLIPTSAIPGFAAIRAFMLLATIVPTLIYLVILYFCARMELVVFEMVVTRAKFIATPDASGRGSASRSSSAPSTPRSSPPSCTPP